MFHNIMQCFFYGEINISAEFTTYKKEGKTAGAFTWYMNAIFQEIFNSISPCIR